jgi:DNA ligase (NAD+)
MKNKDSTHAQKRITLLRDEIEKHNHLYHTLDAPQISDQAFDTLVRELRDLEEQFPFLKQKTKSNTKSRQCSLRRF